MLPLHAHDKEYRPGWRLKERVSGWIRYFLSSIWLLGYAIEKRERCYYGQNTLIDKASRMYRQMRRLQLPKC